MILLDTHALVWMVADPKQLSRAASRAIQEALRKDGLAISAITLWELASLISRGRIQAYGTLDASVRLLIEGVTIKHITPEIAALATQFGEDFSKDPADRLIGATARSEGFALVTRDRNMRTPFVVTVW